MELLRRRGYFEWIRCLENVSQFEFSPVGYIPNDWIELSSVVKNIASDNYRFEFSLGASHEENIVEVTLIVVAQQTLPSRCYGSEN